MQSQNKAEIPAGPSTCKKHTYSTEREKHPYAIRKQRCAYDTAPSQ
jgi:hypothetical protein